MLIFGLRSTSDDRRAGRWTRALSATPLQPEKLNAYFWITFNFRWSAGLVDGLEPYLPPLCSQKNKILVFGLRTTSDDRPGWSMDSNPICHPSPAKKNKMLLFGLCLTSDDRPVWSMDSTPSATPLQPKKLNAHFWIILNFWWSVRLIDGLEPRLPPFSSEK